jgi:hypothetical protein
MQSPEFNSQLFLLCNPLELETIDGADENEVRKVGG